MVDGCKNIGNFIDSPQMLFGHVGLYSGYAYKDVVCLFVVLPLGVKQR
jgi:hypothetical protein